MEGDELELEKIGDRKTALFCIVSDTDMTFNFISAMVYTQMFNGGSPYGDRLNCWNPPKAARTTTRG